MTAAAMREQVRSARVTGAAGALVVALAFAMMVIAAPSHPHSRPRVPVAVPVRPVPVRPVPVRPVPVRPVPVRPVGLAGLGTAAVVSARTVALFTQALPSAIGPGARP
jgi:hypothetical protein